MKYLGVTGSIIGLALSILPLVASAQETAAPVAGYCPQITQNLYRGLKDVSTIPQGQVTELQKFLSDYYDIDPMTYVTGFFGRMTQLNVMKFQREQSIVPLSGFVGVLTRAAIANVCGTAVSTPTGTPRPVICPAIAIWCPVGQRDVTDNNCHHSCVANDGPITTPVVPVTNASCTFNGQTIADGQNVTAYQAPTEPAGFSCVAQTRTCHNGTLDGGYQYVSCTVATPAAIAPTCTISTNPTSISAGQSASLTWASSQANSGMISSLGTMAPSGVARVAPSVTTQYAGTFWGPGGTAQCTTTLAVTPVATTIPSTSCTFSNQTIADGQGAVAYQSSTVVAGQQCVSQVRTCHSGVLDGTYQFGSCSTPSSGASCVAARGTVSTANGGTASLSSCDVSCPTGKEAGCYSQMVCTSLSTYTCHNGQWLSQITQSAGSCDWNGNTYPTGATITLGQSANASSALSSVAAGAVAVVCAYTTGAQYQCENGNWILTGAGTGTGVGACPGMVAAKPVIYLYPQKTENVQVALNYAGAISASYPAYNPMTHGWNVTAQPDGTLTDATGMQYNYLFWEGDHYNFTIDEGKGFVVQGSDTRAFLEQKLAQLGLTRHEADEFIVYWLPKMQGNPYNFVQFVGSEYTKAAPLTITPKPDAVLRVFMAWKPLAEPVAVTPQTITPFTRNGFTVVEWGGTEI